MKGGNEQTILASLYNFGNEKTIGLRTWQLQPGLYKLRSGIDRNNDGIADESLADTTIELKERVNDISLNLPAGKLLIVSVEQLKTYSTGKSAKPDLALAARDITFVKNAGEEVDVQAVIHNIGNLAVRNCKVMLAIDGQVKDSLSIPLLEAPNDLKPRSKQVIFRLKPSAGLHMLTIMASCGQAEITTLNNSVSVKMQ